jgi:hypothetical protein
VTSPLYFGTQLYNFLIKDLHSHEPFFIFTTSEKSASIYIANAIIKTLITEKAGALTLDDQRLRQEMSDKTEKFSGEGDQLDTYETERKLEHTVIADVRVKVRRYSGDDV